MAVDYSAIKAQAQANLKNAIASGQGGLSIQPSTPTNTTSTNKTVSTPTVTTSTSVPKAPSVPTATTVPTTPAPAKDLSGVPGFGSMYKNLAGTNYYSTNPGNRYAAYYNVDGTPVAHIGYASYDGTNKDAFASNDIYNNLSQYTDATAQYDALKNLFNTGQVQDFSSIASMSKDPMFGLSGGTSNVATQTSSLPLGPLVSSVGNAGLGQSPSQSGLPAYGSNVQNFNPNNPDHIALANAGQEWAKAKAAGDTAGMAAAAKLGEQIRAGLTGSTYDSRSGVSTLGAVTPQNYSPGTGNAQGNIFSPGSFGGYDPTAQERTYMDMQLASLRGQSDSALKNAMFGIDQNKAYLEEQLGSLGEEQALSRQNLLDQQNRFGGLYSGGVNYQGGMQDRSFGAARSGLTRDIASRNQQLIDQYGTQANTIAQNIQTLQFNQPDILRQRIQDWVNNERNYGLDYANTFGNLNGQQTLDSTKQAQDQAQREWENRFAYGQATGTFNNGQKTLEKSAQEWNQNFQQEQFDWNKAQSAWENAFKTKSFEQDMKEAAASRGLQWASLDQRQKEFVADQAFREKQFQLDQDKFNASLNQPTSYETSPDFAADVSAITSGKRTLTDVTSNAEAFINAYGWDGYQSLVKAATPKE